VLGLGIVYDIMNLLDLLLLLNYCLGRLNRFCIEYTLVHSLDQREKLNLLDLRFDNLSYVSHDSYPWVHLSHIG